MSFGTQDVLTVAGASVLILILVGAIKAAAPTFDSARFGALTSILLGILLVVAANATAIADVRLGTFDAVIVGILAGASASGLYDAGRGAQRTAIVGGMFVALILVAFVLLL